MKWYFACNSASGAYFPLIKAAVLSAKKNTTLEPHFIYDGEPDDLTQWLSENGVNIIYHRVSFYGSLEKHYSKDFIHIPAGAFLRCDIPTIEKEEETILYTDCDVLFLKDINAENSPRPEYFACSSQFNKRDFYDFNTGVMFMNVKKLAQSYSEFVDYIKTHLDDLLVFDQSAYQNFYCKYNEKLDIKYNHKPYWGIDENAIILHFHGPKPINFAKGADFENFPILYRQLYKQTEKNGAYDYYLSLFKEFYPLDFDYESMEKLRKGLYPLNAAKRPLKLRMKSFCMKFVNRLKVLFNIS